MYVNRVVVDSYRGLKGLDFDFLGQKVVFVGGVGKSTLLKGIAHSLKGLLGDVKLYVEGLGGEFVFLHEDCVGGVVDRNVYRYGLDVVQVGHLRRLNELGHGREICELVGAEEVKFGGGVWFRYSFGWIEGRELGGGLGKLLSVYCVVNRFKGAVVLLDDVCDGLDEYGRKRLGDLLVSCVNGNQYICGTNVWDVCRCVVPSACFDIPVHI